MVKETLKLKQKQGTDKLKETFLVRVRVKVKVSTFLSHCQWEEEALILFFGVLAAAGTKLTDIVAKLQGLKNGGTSSISFNGADY